MFAQQKNQTLGTLERVAPFVPTCTLAVLLGHIVLNSLLKHGVLGRTPSAVMAVPVLIYFVTTLVMLSLTGWLLVKRRLAALWYLIATLLAVGGLVMAIHELNQFLMVA
jgi:hypothetical protein